MKISASTMSAEMIVEKYLDMVYRLAYARTENVEDAEDVTQEVFLKFIKCDKTFKDEEHVKAWLLKVTINQVKTNATNAYNRHRADFDEAADIIYEEKKPLGVVEAMKQLPGKYSIVLHLFYFDELSIKQIAKAMGCSEGTVKSQLSRGREMLKKVLQEEYDYE